MEGDFYVHNSAPIQLLILKDFKNSSLPFFHRNTNEICLFFVAVVFCSSMRNVDFLIIYVY